MTVPQAAENWTQASRQWSRIGAPLRPSRDDVGAAEAAIADHFRQTARAPDGLLLGVTPELASCRWPAGTRLCAIDNSEPMIRSLWPAPGVPETASALCGDWRAMPIADRSIDVAVGDGCFSAAPFGDAPTIGRELHRVLRPDGVVSIRLFTRPDHPETFAGLRAAVAAGQVASVHALKWRVAALVQPSIEDGARLRDIWDMCHSLAAEMAALADRPGWLPEEVATLERYRGNELRYYFPTVAEFLQATAPWFEEAGRSHGRYPLSERCPTFRLRPR